MYAIVEIAGQQFKVEKEQEIFVHRLEGEEGASIEFDNVLFFDNDGKIDIGNPLVDGVLIKAKIIEHLKGDKVIVFHKKRRKGYQKENGHRQYLSKVLIEDILTGAKKSAKKEEKPKAETKKAAATKAETKKEEPKAEVKKEEPKTAAKKEEAKAEVKKEEPKAEVKVEKEEKKAEEAVKKVAPKAESQEKPETEADDNTENKA